MVDKLKSGKTYRWGLIGQDVYKCIGWSAGGDAFAECVSSNDKSHIGKGIVIRRPQDWTEYVEPKSGKIYMNVYGNGCQYTYNTRAEADKYAGPTRLACVVVPWTEGQGLECVDMHSWQF